MIWFNTGNCGKSGFIQARLYNNEYPIRELGFVEFHAPVYYAEITRHVKGYVEHQLSGRPEFSTLDDAKAWTTAVVALS